jgi:apolipoprotein N-acyltransferase
VLPWSLSLVTVWGSARLAGSALTRQGDPIRVGMLQGNVDQAEKWDRGERRDFQDYLRKTEEAIAKALKPVWPEASTPFLFEDDKPSAELVRVIARRSSTDSRS